MVNGIGGFPSFNRVRRCAAAADVGAPLHGRNNFLMRLVAKAPHLGHQEMPSWEIMSCIACTCLTALPLHARRPSLANPWVPLAIRPHVRHTHFLEPTSCNVWFPWSCARNSCDGRSLLRLRVSGQWLRKAHAAPYATRFIVLLKASVSVLSSFFLSEFSEDMLFASDEALRSAASFPAHHRNGSSMSASAALLVRCARVLWMFGFPPMSS